MKIKPRLFVDMDGTLAEWRNISISLEQYEDMQDISEKINNMLKTPGYFYSLRPQTNVLKAVKKITQEDNIEVFILSCVLKDGEKSSPRNEKNNWLNKHLPEIDTAHRIFVPDGHDKRDYVPHGVNKNDYLLDDYTKNLEQWSVSGTGIKLLNNVNSSKGTWKGNQVSFDKSWDVIKNNIESIVLSKDFVKDENPPKKKELFDYKSFDFAGSVADMNESERERQ